MGTVFKKYVHESSCQPGGDLHPRRPTIRSLEGREGKEPKGPVIVGKDGDRPYRDRVAPLRAQYRDVAQYRDGGRVLRVVPTGCKDETAARSVLAELDAEPNWSRRAR